ncbi:hypothetical protein [Salinigranum marinum]|uniref:hypothetical protein n=1 Tax=Salinigranum marinum TaxID=1515595 RepID=UPI002989C125|nr:hypothetical protein [Salinigranum marinum]
MARPPAPTLPALDGRGWTLAADREEVRFELPTMRVLAHTLVYHDDALRERVREATGIDHTWRFFFATRLGFEPPLPPLTGTASVYGSVRSESRDAFVEDLRERGVGAIERGRTERARTETGDRVSLTRYRGRYRLEEDGGPLDVPIAGLLGVWTHDGDFRLAGGWYPEQSLASTLNGAPETDPNEFRNELIDLVRGTR